MPRIRDSSEVKNEAAAPKNDKNPKEGRHFLVCTAVRFDFMVITKNTIKLKVSTEYIPTLTKLESNFTNATINPGQKANS